MTTFKRARLETMTYSEAFSRILIDEGLKFSGWDFDKLGPGALLGTDLPENCIHQNHVFRVRAHTDKLEPAYFAN
jgi:type I restriction enzyme, S subunit